MIKANVKYDNETGQLIVISNGDSFTLNGVNQSSNKFSNIELGEHELIVHLNSDSKRFVFVLYCLESINNCDSFHVAYNLDYKGWFSFYDYIPTFLNSDTFKFWSFNKNEIYKENVGFRGVYYGIVYPSYFDIKLDLQTDENLNPIQLQAINWKSLLVNSSNVPVHNKTFDYISLRNYHQSTGKIKVDQKATKNRFTFTQTRSYIKDENRESKFIKDINNGLRLIDSVFEIEDNKDYLWDDFIIVRLEFENKTNYKINFYEIEKNIR